MMQLLTAGFCLAIISLKAQQAETTGDKTIISPQPRAGLKGKILQPWFYLTRINGNGNEERVSPSYTFAAGSKAYLCILPASEGHLAVFVGDSPELKHQQVYYPEARRNGRDDDLVRQDETIKVPVTFDNKPGTTRFTVLLIQEGQPRSGSLIAAIHDRRSDAGAIIQAFIEGGKGIVRTVDNYTPQGEPPVIWSKLSLRNQ